MNFLKSIKRIPFIGTLLRQNRNRILRLLPLKWVLNFYNKTDWQKIDTEIAEFYRTDHIGITAEKRNPKVIVSLTSYPARIPRIHYTLISLIQQTVKPDEIVLWLGDEQFPSKENDLPETVLKLREHGLSIRWTKDIRSYKKLVPALKEFPNDVIVTADDDILYPSVWLEKLLASYETDKTVIHCHRAHKTTFKRNGNLQPYSLWQGNVSFRETTVSYRNFLTGVGGVLYPPNSLFKDIINEELFLKLCPNADDVWFWAMAVIQGTKICVVKDNIVDTVPNVLLTPDDIIGVSGLAAVNVTQGQNDVQIRNVFAAYPQLQERLGLV